LDLLYQLKKQVLLGKIGNLVRMMKKHSNSLISKIELVRNGKQLKRKQKMDMGNGKQKEMMGA
jgi:hypothetical protein